MQLLEEEKLDRKIVGYLASLAGRNSRRFCAPPVDRIRFAAAWAMPDDFIESRLAHLVATGRIDHAIGENGEPGFIVLPERLWKLGRKPAPAELELTAADKEFLAGIGIAAR